MPEAEVTRLLRELMRFDTTNPPGNEKPAAEFLAELFRKEGLEPVLVEPAPGRGNVVTRLKGDGSKPPLLLSAHLDVVPAIGDWTHPPFAAEIHDGCIWGRGAIDMKHMAAMSAWVLCELKRRGVRLKRDLIFAGVADEEAGGEFGAGYLADHRRELIQAEYCLTEVGGMTVHGPRGVLVPVQTAQKGYLWFKMRAKGRGGHGSKPIPGAAVETLAEAVLRLSREPLDYRVTKTARRFLKELAAVQSPAGALVVKALSCGGVPARAALKAFPQAQREALYAMLHDTAAVTGLSAGVKVNVIPDQAEAIVDGRFLPGTTREEYLERVRAVVGPDIAIEPFDGADPLEIEPDRPLWQALEETMGLHLPGAKVVPFQITGMTDAKDYHRAGIKTYGFSPVLLGPDESFSELYHAPNERIPVSGFEAGSRWLLDAVLKLC